MFKSQETRRKQYHDIYGDVWAKYIIILFKNRLNSLIDFSASDWYNKIPISLFERPETQIP